MVSYIFASIVCGVRAAATTTEISAAAGIRDSEVGGWETWCAQVRGCHVWGWDVWCFEFWESGGWGGGGDRGRIGGFEFDGALGSWILKCGCLIFGVLQHAILCEGDGEGLQVWNRRRAVDLKASASVITGSAGCSGGSARTHREGDDFGNDHSDHGDGYEGDDCDGNQGCHGLEWFCLRRG